jgi:hypothetical protein
VITVSRWASIASTSERSSGSVHLGIDGVANAIHDRNIRPLAVKFGEIAVRAAENRRAGKMPARNLQPARRGCSAGRFHLVENDDPGCRYTLQPRSQSFEGRLGVISEKDGKLQSRAHIFRGSYRTVERCNPGRMP